MSNATTSGLGEDELAPHHTENTELHVFYYLGACITLMSSLVVIVSYLKVRI